jgi:ferric-dicitrate binding protein FerR (iron transport regulator)
MDEHVVEGRLDLIDAKLEHAFERIEKVEEDLRAHVDDTQAEEESAIAEARHEEGRRVNRIVIWLFVAEVLIGVGEFWLMVRHG